MYWYFCWCYGLIGGLKFDICSHKGKLNFDTKEKRRIMWMISVIQCVYLSSQHVENFFNNTFRDKKFLHGLIKFLSKNMNYVLK